jgi:hypothetical protein
VKGGRVDADDQVRTWGIKILAKRERCAVPFPNEKGNDDAI